MIVIFGPLAALTTSALTVTLASLSASLVMVEPSTTRSGVRSMLSPALPLTLSMMRTSPTETFSWRPPARTIAYTGNSLAYFGGHALSVWTGRQLPARNHGRPGAAVTDAGRWAHQGQRLPGGGVLDQTGRPARIVRGGCGCAWRMPGGSALLGGWLGSVLGGGLVGDPARGSGGRDDP